MSNGNWLAPDGMMMPACLHPDVLALTAPRRPTPDGVARRFGKEQGGKLRFCHEAQAWFVWNGAVWRRDRTGLVLQRVREVARDMATNPAGETFRAAGQKGFVADVESLARSDPDLAVGAEAWPDDPFRLGTPEGPVDLRSGTRIEADPIQGLRRSTAVAPSRDAECPTWRRFLDEACGRDPFTAAFLRGFLGYVTTGSVAEQAMLFLCGPGGTGKSVLVNTLLHVMGDYARAAPLDLLAVGARGCGTDLAAFAGDRLLAVAEGDDGWRWDERRLRLLTGGDPVATDRGASVRPSFKLIVAGRRPPRLAIVDPEVRRRLCIVPFGRPPQQPDRHLETRLREEAPAILRWLIEAARDWTRCDPGLGRCPAVEAATTACVAAQDPLGRFLAECCEGSPDDWTRSAASGDLYRAWSAWAEETGEERGTQRAFAEALAGRGYPRDRSEGVRFYRGLALKEGQTLA